VQLEKADPSSLHSKLADSFEENAKLAVVALTAPLGPESMFVSGGVLSTVTVRPSEVVALREADCHLPGRGWGRIDLATSEPRAGRA